MANRPRPGQTKERRPPPNAAPNAGWFEAAPGGAVGVRGKLSLRELKRPGSVVRRLYRPGMQLRVLRVVVNQAKSELDAEMAQRLTPQFIGTWHRKHRVTNSDALVDEMSDAFYRPQAGTTGAKDKRYMGRRKFVSLGAEVDGSAGLSSAPAASPFPQPPCSSRALGPPRKGF